MLTFPTSAQQAMPVKALLNLVSRKRPRAHAIPDGRRLYGVGDIHGRLELLDRLLETIEEDDRARGRAAGLAPENTMEAFDRSLALGVGVLETDVRVTADGVVVAFHDEDLGRVTDLTGPVASTTWP